MEQPASVVLVFFRLLVQKHKYKTKVVGGPGGAGSVSICAFVTAAAPVFVLLY